MEPAALRTVTVKKHHFVLQKLQTSEIMNATAGKGNN